MNKEIFLKSESTLAVVQISFIRSCQLVQCFSKAVLSFFTHTSNSETLITVLRENYAVLFLSL